MLGTSADVINRRSTKSTARMADGMVKWWEWSNGGRNGQMVGMVEWREWRTEWSNAEWQEWWNGRMAEWSNGGMVEWWNGKNGKMAYGGMAYETE
jgi:hypothetical protein